MQTQQQQQQAQRYQTAIKQYAIVSMVLILASILAPLIILGSSMGIIFITLGISLILNLGWAVPIFYLSVDALRKTFIWYLGISSLLLLPIAFMAAQRNDPSSCLYYMIIPLSCYVMLPPRKVIGWAVYAFILMLLAFLPHCIFEDPLAEYLRFDDKTLHYNRSLLILKNMMNLLIIFLHLCLTLYYIHKIHEIRGMAKSPAPSAPSAENDNKFDTLYRQIVDFMETDKPFCDPTFNIALLATATDSNVSYVSNAIHEKTGMSFSTFINSYRVEFAKKALQQADTKYTIEHLSLSAGFSHQTTFNRAFKASEGITPTEYMNVNQKKVKKKKN